MSRTKLKRDANFLEHNRPTLGRTEEEAVLKVLRSGWVAQGIEVESFENEFCDFLGLAHGYAVAVSSGTAALYLALLALEAQGKNVALPAYACSALRHAVTLAGGKPCYIDSGLHSPNLNLSLIDTQIEISIIPHLYGLPQKINQQRSLVIEDCAQALGARIDEIPAGLQADLGIYSFYATKLITTGGQGGMIVSRNQAFIDFIKDFRQFDQRNDKLNRFNFQMTDLQAAVGRAQLKRLPQFLSRRAEIYQQYRQAGLPLLDVDAQIGLRAVRYRAILYTCKQAEIISTLAQEKIIATLPLQSWEVSGSREEYPNAFRWIENSVSLPIYPLLTEAEVECVIRIVTNIL